MTRQKLGVWLQLVISYEKELARNFTVTIFNTFGINNVFKLQLMSMRRQMFSFQQVLMKIVDKYTVGIQRL